MSLFDTDAAPVAGPDAKVVRLLEGYGYRREAVRLWTAEQANTVLRACRREERIALNRAEKNARDQDGTPRGQPTWMERQEAAAFVAGAVGIDEVVQAVAYTAYCLTDDELRRVAGYFVRLFRGQDGQRPGPATAVCRTRVDGGTDAGRAAAGGDGFEAGAGAGAAD